MLQQMLKMLPFCPDVLRIPMEMLLLTRWSFPAETVKISRQLLFLSSFRLRKFASYNSSFNLPYKFNSQCYKSGQCASPRPRLIKQQRLVNLAVADERLVL
jgi:hypothetical protein